MSDLLNYAMLASFALYTAWSISELAKQDATLAANAIAASDLIQELHNRICALESKEPKP